MSKDPIIRVLVVDDEIDHADALSEVVARIGYAVKQAHNLVDAKRYFTETWWMPNAISPKVTMIWS
ncbi:MAG: response regulator [Planctomycetes bacterium]|nr:response regulator [Planctomycetota bacterium]